MNNNNNHNGKEVQRGQVPVNGQKGNGNRNVNRIKKKNSPEERDNPNGEPKKISIHINKNLNSPKAGNHKGQVIKLGDKDSRMQPVETPLKESPPPYSRPVTPSNYGRTSNKENDAASRPTTPADDRLKEMESTKLSKDANSWLLVAAVILLIGWALVFFYFKAGGNSHMLLALAVVCAVVALVRRSK